MRTALKVAVMQGGAAPVVIPDAAFSWVDFPILQYGRTFSTPLNLQSRANITVAKTYYVDKAVVGGDGSGDSWANALTTITAAWQKADIDRMYVRAGYYYSTQSRGDLVPARSIEMIAVGGPVYMTTDTANTCGAWTAVDAHYTASQVNAVSDVWDASILDALGSYTRLTKKTSEAEVDAASGSWYLAANVLYIHLADGRAPDTNVRQFTASNCISMVWDSLKYYIEGVKFLGGISALNFKNASATGELYGYFKDCDFGYCYNKDVVVVAGATEVIFQNCRAFNGTTLDGFGYAALNAVVPHVVEIGCESFTHGTATAHQCSTTHDAISVLRIMGKYHHSAGHNISDVGSGYSWLLGSELYSSGIGYGISQTQLKTWLDCCYIHDNAVRDVDAPANTVYARNLISGGNFTNPLLPY